MMHLTILLDDTGFLMKFVTDTLTQLGNPTLVLLLMALVSGIYYFMKQLKKKDLQLADKEIQIKELNNTSLERSITNLKIIHDIESSIDKNDDRNRFIETLLRDNNSFLKSIIKSLNI